MPNLLFGRNYESIYLILPLFKMFVGSPQGHSGNCDQGLLLIKNYISNIYFDSENTEWTLGLGFIKN